MARSAARQQKPRRPSVSKADKLLFSERLKTLMQERGLTIAETARRVRRHLGEGEGFDDTNLIHYRQARSVPRPAHLDALSKALGVRPADLLGDAMPPPGEAREPRSIARSVASGLRIIQTSGGNGEAQSPIQAIEDHGEKVLLRFEQLVPWSVALQILHALKDGGVGEMATG